MLIEAGDQEIYHFYSQPSRPVPLSVPAEVNERPSNIMTYSNFTIPKVWSQQSTDDLLVAVYSYVKTYIR